MVFGAAAAAAAAAGGVHGKGKRQARLDMTDREICIGVFHMFYMQSLKRVVRAFVLFILYIGSLHQFR